MIYDGDDLVLTADEYRQLDVYDCSVPTGPSAGRIYVRRFGKRLGEGNVFIVKDDPDKPGWQIHVPHRPEIAEHENGTHRVDGHYYHET